MTKIDTTFPDRPTHPDFWALSQAVTANDGHADHGLSIQQILDGADIDAESLFYVANQRALRMIRSLTEPNSVEELVANMSAVWIDAFLAGLKVGDERARIDNEQLLDESIDSGNRRQLK